MPFCLVSARHSLDSDPVIPIDLAGVNANDAAVLDPHITPGQFGGEGVEERVLRGAATTLTKFHPAVFIEIDDAALRNMNSSARAVLALFERFGYRPHRLGKGQIVSPLPADEVVYLCHNGKHSDFLFIHPDAGL